MESDIQGTLGSSNRKDHLTIVWKYLSRHTDAFCDYDIIDDTAYVSLVHCAQDQNFWEIFCLMCLQLFALSLVYSSANSVLVND